MNKKKSNNRVFAIVIILILVFLGLLIWFIASREPNFTGDRVDFEIVGSRNIQSGGLVEYRVIYENREGTSLKDVEVTLIYPDGFTFESSSEKPDNEENNNWEIRKISPGDKDEIMVSGKLCGNPDDMKNIKAMLNYTPSGVASSFQEEAEIEVKILKTSFSINTDFPELVSKEDSLTYSIKVKNEENFDISNLRIRIKYPKNFELIKSEPEATSDNNVWDFSQIKASEEKEIKIEQKARGELEDEKKLNIEAGVFDQNGNYFKQKEEIFNTKISKVDVDLKYLVNGKENITINQDKDLNFKLQYKNTGTEKLSDIKIEAEINEEFLNEDSIKVESGKYEGGKIIWNLKEIKKGKKGELKFRAKVKNNIDSNEVSDPVLKSQVKLVNSNSEAGINIKRESKELEIKIGSKVKLEAIGRYYDFDNKKIGSGPIPPKVGDTTIYRVYLFISNTTSELLDGQVEITLPNNVSWTGVKDVNVGNLSFIDKKLIWSIGKIDKNLVSEDKRLEASFEVGITPNDDQVDNYITLVKKATFMGKDLHTEKDIKVETKSITTKLENDSNVKDSQGKVEANEDLEENQTQDDS